MELAAELDEVSYRFGRRWALIRLSVQIPRYRATIVTGRNGAGKTTLLRILATALRPSYGTLKLFGQDSDRHRDAIRQRIGLVTHQSHLYEDLSALENLRLVERLRGYRDVDLPRILARVGLADQGERSVRTYSAGMKRRLCIARLLVRAPDLALIDEPFGRLDPEGVDLMEEIILELKRGGTTVVVSTHDLERGRRLSDLNLELVNGEFAGELVPVHP